METLTEHQRAQLETVNGLNNKLIWAIFKGTAESVEYFIQQGAEIEHRDKDGRTPIYLAGRDGRHEALDILIKHGGNMEFDGDRGSTSLYVAAQNGHPRCVEVLIKHGANLECKFTGFYTPVYIAAQKGFDEIVEMLIKAGASIEAPCPHGSTALFVSSQNGHARATRVLLENGANTEVCFNSKTTPLEQAASRNRKDCVQLLLQFGAHFEKSKSSSSSSSSSSASSSNGGANSIIGVSDSSNSSKDCDNNDDHNSSSSHIGKLFRKFREYFKRIDKQYVVTCKKTIEMSKTSVKCLAAQKNIIFIAMQGDHTVSKWDVLTNEFIGDFRGHTDQVTCLHVSEDVLYSGSADRKTICWDIYTGEKLQVLQGHTSAITTILYHTYTEKDKQNFVVAKKIVYTGSADKTVKGYDPADGTRKVKFEGHRGTVTALYAKNYKIYQMAYDVLYTASLDCTVRAYDIEAGTFLMEFTGGQGPITSMSEYEDVLFTASSENILCTWDRLRGKLINKYEHHTEGITCMKVYKGVLFTGSSDNTIKTWDCKTLNILQTLEGHTGAITDICMGSDMIYTSSDDKTIRCWVLQKAAINKDEAKNLNAISIADKQYFTAYNNRIDSWELNGTHLHKVTTKSATTCLVPQGEIFYVGFADSTIKVFSTYTGELLMEFTGHKERVNCITIHSSYLISGSNDRSVRVYDKKTAEEIGSFEADGPILTVAADDNAIFAGLSDKIVTWPMSKIKK